MFRHAEFYVVSRGIELTVSSLSRLRYLHVPKLNKYLKFLRIVDPKNKGNSSVATWKQKNMSERENKKKIVGGVWTDVSFWTRAPGVRMYKAHTEFGMDKRDTKECESFGERLCYCCPGRRAVAIIP